MSFEIQAQFDQILEETARVPLLLVASDYDGTLSAIVENPEDAVPDELAISALQELASLPRTHSAIISGRSLQALRDLTGAPEGVRLVGSHGAEFDETFANGLPEESRALLQQLTAELELIASNAPGATVEVKPASVALHVRRAEANLGERAMHAVLDGPALRQGVHVKHGKMVIELSVFEADKGQAIEHLRHRIGASTVLFVGDDITDEDAFGVLRNGDMSVKVGHGESVATLRVESTDDVTRMLTTLVTLRRAWLNSQKPVPIQHHSMLSDQRTIALIDDQASVAWLCAPRIDSPAIFASLLGGQGAGRFIISDADGNAPERQSYAGDSLVLRSSWPKMQVTDYLDCSGDLPKKLAKRVVLVRAIEGTGTVRIEYAPRLDYGRMPTRLQAGDGVLRVVGGLDDLTLHCPGVTWDLQDEGLHQTAIAEVKLGKSGLRLELCYGDEIHSAGNEPVRRKSTEKYWSDWAETLQLPSLRPELMRRSALVLRGLVQGPSGAIAAAGTTSLPEYPGGERNWDYRYCWPRDAAMSATALVKLGSTQEAAGLLDWLGRVVERAGGAERLVPIYTVDGGPLPPESDIESLSGYLQSRPVRTGNAADHQVQLDVFGPVTELVWVLCEAGVQITEEHLSLVNSMADAVVRRWGEPDHGIWEIRGPKQHHVHSKAMCWLTLDRAARLSERCSGRVKEDYRRVSEQIKAEVLEQGWNEKMNSYTSAYGQGVLDAATLTLGLSGMIEPGDYHFSRTVEAIEKHLRHGPTVYRYRYDDGLPGDEGGFHICATWLVEAYALVGRLDDARALFDAVADLAGPTGHLSEQHDPRSGLALGNHPQAYSHLGLIEAALRLDRCE